MCSDVHTMYVLNSDIRLEHKWHCQLSLLTASNPDYEKQSVPYLHSNVEGECLC